MIIAFALIALLALAAPLWPEVPRWRFGGTKSVATASVSYGTGSIACPGPDARIAIFGDSHVAGARMSDPGGKPFGEVLEAALDGRAKVALHGVGGITAQMGEARWATTRPDARTIILAYGTNDAAPRGWLSERSAVPLTAFTASLGRQVVRWRGERREVILLAPPPAGSAAIMRRLSPYREAIRDLGESLEAAVLDPADAFASCPQAEPLLVRDALHMNAAGHRCLGEWMARKLCPGDAGGLSAP